MKKLKNLFAVLAFCACLVIPFTACGGYNSGIVESYTYDPSGAQGPPLLTVKLKDIENLPQYIEPVTIFVEDIAEYGSIKGYFSNNDILKHITAEMNASSYFLHEKNEWHGFKINEEREIMFSGDIPKYIFLYDVNNFPYEKEILEEFYETHNTNLLESFTPMDFNTYVGFVEIKDV